MKQEPSKKNKIEQRWWSFWVMLVFYNHMTISKMPFETYFANLQHQNKYQGPIMGLLEMILEPA